MVQKLNFWKMSKFIKFTWSTATFVRQIIFLFGNLHPDTLQKQEAAMFYQYFLNKRGFQAKPEVMLTPLAKAFNPQ